MQTQTVKEAELLVYYFNTKCCTEENLVYFHGTIFFLKIKKKGDTFYF